MPLAFARKVQTDRSSELGEMFAYERIIIICGSIEKVALSLNLWSGREIIRLLQFFTPCSLVSLMELLNLLGAWDATWMCSYVMASSKILKFDQKWSSILHMMHNLQALQSSYKISGIYHFLQYDWFKTLREIFEIAPERSGLKLRVLINSSYFQFCFRVCEGFRMAALWWLQVILEEKRISRDFRKIRNLDYGRRARAGINACSLRSSHDHAPLYEWTSMVRLSVDCCLLPATRLRANDHRSTHTRDSFN